MKVKRFKYWFKWNKKTVMKTIAIVSVPLIGVSAFLGYWFLKPEPISNEIPEPEQPITEDPETPPINDPDNPNYNHHVITPIENNLLYPTTNYQSQFIDRYVKDVLYENFPSMIDWYQEDTNPDSVFKLYYEITSDNELNLFITEEVDDEVINETKFIYEII